MTADEIIHFLDLKPHPEGGYFRETFRDPAIDHAGRSAGTAIYFLLRAGEVSRWHRVDASEIWLWHAGAALELAIMENDAMSPRTLRLGIDLRAGERPQAVVPMDRWQQARSHGSWTLVSCTVAPGFSFDGFEMATADFDPSKTA
ncbi:MAG TPA: cupin domain-containing protein [Hyphomicrobiaceae bacterium]|nr:cupin domain-containing protein [Hyphomicrobiaceae bacterium]